MSDSPRRPLSPAGLGFASHLLAGVLPFLSSGAIARLGLMRGTATLYVAGTLLLVFSLAHHRVRGWLRVETGAFAARGRRSLFLLGLAGFLVAGMAYYVGLARTPRVAEYIFLTRLDWLVQATFAIVWLREPWTRRGLTGAVLALAGGIMLAWSGAFGVSGLAAAATYILASLVGYSCFKPLSAQRGSEGAVVLTMWRHWVNTAGFVFLALVLPAATPGDPAAGLVFAGIAGVILVVLFLLRFSALAGIPLWVLSAQAPTQAVVAILVTAVTTGALPWLTILAIALIATGEVLVASTRRA